jgi:hypothetical protein
LVAVSSFETIDGADLVKHGRICRVEKVMRPYPEALL